MKTFFNLFFILIFTNSFLYSQRMQYSENPYPKFVPYIVEQSSSGELNLEIDNKDAGKEQPARWLLVDPVADKYPGWSPYNYTQNNPLKFIDPNGNEIVISIGENKNGSVKYIRFNNGKLYDGDKIYTGGNKFALKIQKTLNNLVSLDDPKVNNMISTLQSESGRYHLISESFSGGDNVVSDDPYKSNLGEKTGSMINVTLSGEDIEGGLATSPESTLGHELLHAFDFDQGNRAGYADEVDIPGNLDPAEIRAVKMENRVRAKQGLELRDTYGGKRINF